MLNVKKSRIGKDYGFNLVKRFRYVYFMVIPGKRIAVVSSRVIRLQERGMINVVEERKLPLYVVDMNMRMGKGYKTTETSVAGYHFVLEKEYINGLMYEVYEVI